MLETLLENLRQAVLEGEDDLAHDLAVQAIDEGIKPVTILDRAIVAGIQAAGELWKENRYFLPDVVMSAEAFRSSLEVVEPHLEAGTAGKVGTIVIGTVAGDMHNLGKLIVAAMLRGAGFDVIDLGEDVPTTAFIDMVREQHPQILGLGCYMSTTMLEIGDVLKALEDASLRADVKVMIGGVPTTQEFADEIGADGWGKDALDAVEKAKGLLAVEAK